MSFLDEDELDPAPNGGGRRSEADARRQIVVRRLIALAVGIGVLLILLFGIRACLDARTERGYENYLSDLNSAVDGSNQVSTGFFSRLIDPQSGTSEIELQANIGSDRSAAESQLQQVEGLDVPGDLSDAQDQLTQAFELRRDALAGVADDIPTALGSEGRSDAIERIVGDMKAFLASDVLFERARLEVNDKLSAEEIEGHVQVSQFLPDPVDRWLDDLSLTSILSTYATETGTVKGIHGVALISTSLDKTDLLAESDNAISLGKDPPQITVVVQNQGDTVEKEVTVSYTLNGGPTPLEGEQVISSIDPGGTSEATIAFDAEPPTDVPLTLEVKVFPVIGESSTDNNTATYTITFN